MDIHNIVQERVLPKNIKGRELSEDDQVP
jgi:hypothetical protein